MLKTFSFGTVGYSFGIFRLHILHAPLWIFSISPGAPVGFPAVSKNLGATILPIA
jgi:hypothetical protein